MSKSQVFRFYANFLHFRYFLIPFLSKSIRIDQNHLTDKFQGVKLFASVIQTKNNLPVVVNLSFLQILCKFHAFSIIVRFLSLFERTKTNYASKFQYTFQSFIMNKKFCLGSKTYVFCRFYANFLLFHRFFDFNVHSNKPKSSIL